MAATPSPLASSVMLVDDHPVMRVGLANVLSLNHGFRIVAQAVARGFELGLLKIGASA
jgi:DNA-binding NarL/FixJ family response regulator